MVLDRLDEKKKMNNSNLIKFVQIILEYSCYIFVIEVESLLL